MSDAALTGKFETAAQFKGVAGGFDSEGTFAHFGQRLVEVVGIEPGQRVLAVATGRGAVRFPAVERVGAAGETVGVDRAEAMVRAANEEAEDRGLGPPSVSWMLSGSTVLMPAFDRVVCGFGVMFVPHLRQALGESRRVLKPRGRRGISTWRSSPGDHPRAVLDELILVRSNDRRPPGWITDPDDLARVIVDAGFTDVQLVEDSLTFVYAEVE
jgi:ubiquinone/menaquinone biosynthesis C-methylase UbiE